MALKWKSSTKEDAKNWNRPPNAVEEFPIHENAKSTDNNVPTDDHDLRYVRLLEAITKTALATRVEIPRASLDAGGR